MTTTTMKAMLVGAGRAKREERDRQLGGKRARAAEEAAEDAEDDESDAEDE